MDGHDYSYEEKRTWSRWLCSCKESAGKWAQQTDEARRLGHARHAGISVPRRERQAVYDARRKGTTARQLGLRG